MMSRLFRSSTYLICKKQLELKRLYAASRKIPEHIKKQMDADLEGTGYSGNELWEPGFGPTEDDEGLPTRKEIKKFINTMKAESKKAYCEWRERIRLDPECYLQDDVIYKMFTFTDPNVFDNWAFTCDSDGGVGYSTCFLERTPNNTLLFHGNISTNFPQDGKTVRSGFASFRTPRAIKSFMRRDYYDWGEFTHLVLKVRGDGRVWKINCGQDDDIHFTWYDLYSYFFFTRGGPYWQIIKIPFSKLILNHKGKVQDNQQEFSAACITFVGITLDDNVEGPFQLEVEYIGVEYNVGHLEENAYETYDMKALDEDIRNRTV